MKLVLSCLLLLTSLYCSAADLSQLTIKKAHQLMESGELTSEQLVNYYLNRIEAHDKNGVKLNSVVTINPDALREARQQDKERSNKIVRGPLYGIPVLLKDNIDTGEGMANTAGSAALKDNFPEDDAFLVKKLRSAGAVILGKTNLSEWANFRSSHSSSGWSGLFGQTKNPYDPTRSPCGSSSGSGVAIAADFALLAVGTETDGSVTCPSSLNGIVGIKPTLGTVSRDGIIPIAHSQDTAGPMARTVTDAVTMLAVMSKFDKADPAPVKSNINYVSHLKKDGLKGKRIGIVRQLMGYNPQVDELFEKAVADLKAQGAEVVDEVKLGDSSAWGEAEYQVLLYEFKTDLNLYLSGTKQGLPKSLADLIAFNKANAAQEMPYFGQEIFLQAQDKGPLSDKLYKDALAKAKKLTGVQGIDAALQRHDLDLLIAPSNQPAWKTDWVNGDHYTGAASSPAAISGYPHITVPMGQVQGLPVGLSFFAGKLSEGTLIEAAYGYEQATQHQQAPAL
ncbi:amidase [Neptunicella marina]|uniref:Amidase n=1 Tax=Neptunicella marina TaxID=2125989 RepID=A0A8J6IUI6_9ALTE|nr:amidase [Neptunicella marina]MBC3766032.1 amidase [Neptunicella marina]